MLFDKHTGHKARGGRNMMKQIFAGLLKFSLEWVNDFFVGTFRTLISSIRNLKDSPITCGIALTIAITRIVAIIFFIVSLVLFIVNNGYGRQLEAFRSGQWSSFETNSMYFNSGIMTTCAALFALDIIVICIAYIIKEAGAKRITMITMMAITAILSALLSLFYAIGLTDEFLMQISHANARIIRFVCLGLLGAPILAAMIMLSLTDLQRQLKLWGYSLLSVFVILPLFVFVIQNVIALVFFLLLYVVLNILVSSMLSDGGSGGSSANTGGGEWVNPRAGSDDPAPLREKKYQVEVKLSYVGHKQPYEGTYVVYASDEGKAKENAAKLLRESLVKSKRVSSFIGEICIGGKYEVKKL